MEKQNNNGDLISTVQKSLVHMSRDETLDAIPLAQEKEVQKDD